MVRETKLPGVLLLTPTVHEDERGLFFEAWSRKELRETFVQDNCSISRAGVLRGLHAQRAPFAQAKLVSVAHGAVFDVAVDIDPASETYGQHVSALLSGENHHALFIPAGYAHGFLALTDAVFLYKCSGAYCREAETGVRFDDPTLAIPWPFEPVLLSQKDRALPRLCELGAPGRLPDTKIF